jgi:hypothetical protein
MLVTNLGMGGGDGEVGGGDSDVWLTLDHRRHRRKSGSKRRRDSLMYALLALLGL